MFVYFALQWLARVSYSPPLIVQVPPRTSRTSKETTHSSPRSLCRYMPPLLPFWRGKNLLQTGNIIPFIRWPGCYNEVKYSRFCHSWIPGHQDPPLTSLFSCSGTDYNRLFIEALHGVRIVPGAELYAWCSNTSLTTCWICRLPADVIWSESASTLHHQAP